MKKSRLFFICLFMTSIIANAQFDFSQVKYWIGNGSDSCVLVIDFQDESNESSIAWGYLFDESTSGETIINAIAEEDINLEAVIGGGFLNDLIYNNHSGLGGNPNYWSTWSGTSIEGLSMNSGVGTSINNGDIFACSYTDFNPAVQPETPIPAIDPFAFTLSDIEYFIGEGTDTAMLIVDFQDGEDAFAWGYIFADSTNGEEILNAISETDPNFEAAISSSFLNDINYLNNTGIGGSPNYWSTWSSTNMANWEMNMGVSTIIKNREIFGCSYTDFSPAIQPNIPTAAFSPILFTIEDANFFIGTGNDTALLIVDFQNGDDSFAWGYIFNDSVTGEDMIMDIANADNHFEAIISSGFLGDITYLDYAGIGGNPNYWSTWSGSSTSGWSMNMGVSTYIKSGDYFGCSYTDFSPALMPNEPQAALDYTIISTNNLFTKVSSYPNPVINNITIQSETKIEKISLYNSFGQIVLSKETNTNNTIINLVNLSQGTYFLHILTNGKLVTKKIIKQ